MQAKEAKFLELLKESQQFIIPIYQRTYSWTEYHCRQLWNDILRTGESDEISAHFVGSIVYIKEGLYQVTNQPSLLVIDGQQRLTTVTLILEALARQLGDSEPFKGFSAVKLRHYYLLNDLEKDEDRFKLLLTQTDKASLLALIQQKPPPAHHSLRISENFTFFEKLVRDLDGDLGALCGGLSKLFIVDVALTRGEDNPQLIFESMNSTGRELSQADLIRNFILMGLEPDQQTELYENHWRPMEVAFGQEAYDSHFDWFMRYYLTLKTGKIPNIKAVYEAFKVYTNTPEIKASGIDALLADIHTFAGYYCAMALNKETDKKLAECFGDLREFKVDVAYPLLLELYSDYANNNLSHTDFEKAVRLIEAYVFRRAVCSIPTNSLNKTFATFGRFLDKDRYLGSIKAYLLLQQSYRRFPRDKEFRRELVERDLYNFRRISYLLRRLENHNRKERVPVDEYTIEHILPQNQNLSDRWKQDLGSEWKRIQETWLHTLGNLTLTGYNSEYSDRPFVKKRNMKGGFCESPLKINEGLGACEVWNEAAIRERADRLASLAMKVWAMPLITPEELESYAKHSKKPASYTIDDHPHLIIGAPMHDLFEAFRNEVRALNPCVAEEFLKLYVAYKAETNFVDVIPLKRCLKLTLNMQFHELHDPRNLARDITGLGRWGNGNIRVEFNGIEELPYVMNLVRQSFEKQMGNGETDT